MKQGRRRLGDITPTVKQDGIYVIEGQKYGVGVYVCENVAYWVRCVVC